MVAVAGPHGDREQEKQSTDAADHALDAELNQIVVLPIPGDLDSIPSHPPGGAKLSKDRARQLTDSIRIDAQGVRAMLLRAYEGAAHIVLGYENFGQYCAAEFGMSSRTAYRSLNAGRVDLILSVPRDTETERVPERVARELASMLDDPDELRETYQVAVETASRDATGEPRVTAAHVREVVERHREKSDAPPADPGPPRTQVTVADAIREVTDAIQVGDHEAIEAAIAGAQRILTRRRMGTSPGALADCVSTLLDAMSALLRGPE